MEQPNLPFSTILVTVGLGQVSFACKVCAGAAQLHSAPVAQHADRCSPQQVMCGWAGFTCSAGIAANKLLAKVGSALHKPNQQTIVPPRWGGGRMHAVYTSALGCMLACGGPVLGGPLPLGPSCCARRVYVSCCCQLAFTFSAVLGGACRVACGAVARAERGLVLLDEDSA